MIEFRMPSLGADMESGTLREWLVKKGDMVKRGDIIAVVETQKGLIEIEVFDEGRIDTLVIKEGDKVPVDTVMAMIIPSEKGAEHKKELTDETKIIKQIQPVQIEEEKKHSLPVGHVKASPLARKIAQINQIDLSKIAGTGENEAITKEDVEKAIKEKSLLSHDKPYASSETIRMAVAAAMSKSNREIPHYYLEKKIDMSKALKWLAEANRQRKIKDRLLPVALLIKAVAKTLVEVPELNGIWENTLIRKKDINIGLVISLRGGGVMIPAIHNTDKRTLDEIMQSLNDIIPRARSMKLRSSELSDSTITITNLSDGADTVYGIIYPPQVAIIGFGTISEQPWAENGMLDVRQVLSVTIAGDHRATDGNAGSRFLTILTNQLQNPEEL